MSAQASRKTAKLQKDREDARVGIEDNVETALCYA